MFVSNQVVVDALATIARTRLCPSHVFPHFTMYNTTPCQGGETTREGRLGRRRERERRAQRSLQPVSRVFVGHQGTEDGEEVHSATFVGFRSQQVRTSVERHQIHHSASAC